MLGGDDAVPTVPYDTEFVEDLHSARPPPALPRTAAPAHRLLERLVAVERRIHAAALRASAVHRDVHLAVVLGASLLFPRQVVLLTLQNLFADGGGDDGTVSKKTSIRLQRALVRFLVEHSEALALDEPLRMCARHVQTDPQHARARASSLRCRRASCSPAGTCGGTGRLQRRRQSHRGPKR